MIKYLGSKRRLVPVLRAMARVSGARTALDLFTGTTRVAQAFKALGIHVTAVDSARYAAAFARCYVETDDRDIDRADLSEVLAALDALDGTDGYVTDVFSRRARFFQRDNAMRIDAVRDEIERSWQGHAYEPLLLTSLIEAADRVDSTAGVQMAYVKRWAPRSYQPLALRVPGRARRRVRGRERARLVRPRISRPALQPAPLHGQLPRVGDARRLGPTL